MSTLNTLLLKSIKKYSNKVFYKSLDDASQVLFKDILSLTYPWLLFFKEKNIQKGDCIAFTLDLSESNIGLLLTIFCFGYVGVPLYPETTQSTCDYIINETKAKFLIFDFQFWIAGHPRLKEVYQVYAVDLRPPELYP